MSEGKEADSVEKGGGNTSKDIIINKEQRTNNKEQRTNN